MSVHDNLPDSFVCAICERVEEPSPWHWHRQHKPPICFYCGKAGSFRARIPGMTRGDHRTMQRLAAVTGALSGAAIWKAHGWI